MRPISVLVTLVLLHLILAESGYACRIAPADAARDSMAGMQMPTAEHATPDAPTQQGEQQMPCHLPWATSGCQTMATCAPTALTVASGATAPFARARVTPRTLEQLAPLSLTSAPDVPPPRA
jgi:hypothetical protein